MKYETYQTIANAVSGGSSNLREAAVKLHDYVRDNVLFGFTPYFDAATADQTLRYARGHCNPQARLMVELFRVVGLDARFRPVTIDNKVLRGVIITPRLLSHVFTEVRIEDHWIRLDSYIVDPELRVKALEKLTAEGRELGYGCHASATGEWDGISDSYSQVATPEMIVELHRPYDDIEEFYASPEFLHRRVGLRFSQMMAPWRLAANLSTKLINVGVDRVREAP